MMRCSVVRYQKSKHDDASAKREVGKVEVGSG